MVLFTGPSGPGGTTDGAAAIADDLALTKGAESCELAEETLVALLLDVIPQKTKKYSALS